MDQALPYGRVGDFRQGVTFLLEWIHMMDAPSRARIDEALRAKLGVGLADADDAMGKEIRSIIMRGAIKDDDECRLLQSWLEIGRSSGGKKADVKEVRRLIDEYLTGPATS